MKDLDVRVSVSVISTNNWRNEMKEAEQKKSNNTINEKTD